ncbi:MAG TPA: tetratricopeptide repeat protein [Bryobacteraceae bacterium]|jgi:tetratricopeptide (TPR) repeat protein|nr:tetratricopeptide repeat protein [Bryobacteraceae bacterium]
MSRWWIGLFAAGTLFAQQNTPSDTSNRPTLRRQDGQSQPQAQPKRESGPQTDELPPDEDVREAPKQYSFNPLQAKKEVSVGNFYFKKGDFKAAAGRFREATKWNDGNAEAWMRLGEAEERRENAKAARYAYRKFLELQPDGKNADEVKKRLEKLKG